MPQATHSFEFFFVFLKLNTDSVDEVPFLRLLSISSASPSPWALGPHFSSAVAHKNTVMCLWSLQNWVPGPPACPSPAPPAVFSVPGNGSSILLVAQFEDLDVHNLWLLSFSVTYAVSKFFWLSLKGESFWLSLLSQRWATHTITISYLDYYSSFLIASQASVLEDLISFSRSRGKKGHCLSQYFPWKDLKIL